MRLVIWLLAWVATGCISRCDTGKADCRLRTVAAEDLEEFAGGHRRQVVLIILWSAHCDACRALLQGLSELRRELKRDGLVVLAINLDAAEHHQRAEHFACSLSSGCRLLRWTNAPTRLPSDRIHPLYNGTLPALVLFNRRGKRVWFHQGGMALNLVRQVILRHL